MSVAEESADLRRTPLYQAHADLGAKFVPFGGWEMPVLYSGVIEEHHCVRQHVGLFDVSHMGEIFVSGEQALEYLQHVTSNDVSKLVPGRAHYSLFVRPGGGIVDDIIVYCLTKDNFLICVNASNTDKDFAWMLEHLIDGVKIENRSADYAQIAVQGPRAQDLMSRLFASEDFSIDAWRPFSHRCLVWMSNQTEVPTIVARTGYTGEDGFEVFLPESAASAFWSALLVEGQDLGVKPIGLGARDTLRLEASYPLYGHELNDDWNALSCGVGWVVKFGKGDFIGREALLMEQEKGLSQKLTGFSVDGRGIVRDGAEIFSSDGKKVGVVTSGTMTPTLGKAVGMMMVDIACAEPGLSLTASVRGKDVPIRVEQLPLYSRKK